MPIITGRCGVLTVEIEHVDVETLEELEREGVDIEPKPITIRIIQVHILIFSRCLNRSRCLWMNMKNIKTLLC
jgi:phosphoribosylaminoimidazole carboxylase (NCAIR synthetase)